MKVIHVSGTRKRAVARATLVPGGGMVRINSRLITAFPENMYRAKIEEPLVLAGDVAKQVNIDISVFGGGPNGQADAIRLAIAKALAAHDKKLHSVFLDYDRTLLVADVRRKEASKPNRQGKARAKTQKSYR